MARCDDLLDKRENILGCRGRDIAREKKMQGAAGLMRNNKVSIGDNGISKATF